MAVKQRIDIEDLLVWAYRTQCVDRSAQARFTPRGPSSSPVSGLAMVLALGTRVDTSGFAATVLGSRTPDDALVVHDAVLALTSVWLEWLAEDGVALWDRTTIANLGCSVSQRGCNSFLVLPDGSSRSVTLAEPSMIVIQNARDNGRPDWHEAWKPMPSRQADDDGEFDRRGRRRKKYTGLSVEHVMLDRALYGVWHAALGLLAAELSGNLADFEVTGPIAPKSPWMLSRRNVLSGGKTPNQNLHKIVIYQAITKRLTGRPS